MKDQWKLERVSSPFLLNVSLIRSLFLCECIEASLLVYFTCISLKNKHENSILIMNMQL